MLENYQDLIEELLHTPALLRALLVDHENPDAVALLAALRDRDRIVLERLQRMIRQQEPHLSALPALSDRAPAATEPFAVVIDSFDNGRGDLVSFLMNMTLRDWEKSATHDDGGHVTLSEELERHVEFDEATVQRIQAAATA